MKFNKNRIQKKGVSVTTLVISCVIMSAGTYFVVKTGSKSNPVETAPPSPVECNERMSQVRLKNYEFIQPLILADINTESYALHDIRSKLEEYIKNVKAEGKAREVSVYFRRLNDGSWFCINPNKTYNPASMSKVIYLITFLREAEINPSILDKNIFFKHHFENSNVQNYKTFSLKEYTTYKIRDLLDYMLTYSDNDAALLLSTEMNLNIYKQLFVDLGEDCPVDYSEYFITPVQFSKFFRLLYNASYIRPDLSELGLKILSESAFKDGLSAGIDSAIIISHKYGERIIADKAQFHEFGIVYYKNDPYLIGVMTEGMSLNELPSIVKEISKISFVNFKKLSNN